MSVCFWKNPAKKLVFMAGLVLLSGCAHSRSSGKAGAQEDVIAKPVLGDKMTYAGVSPQTQKPLYTMSGDAPNGPYSWDSSTTYCKKLREENHHDWRLPTQNELALLFQNRDTIGGFVESSSSFPSNWYWSSTKDGNEDVWVRNFNDGVQASYGNSNRLSLRCVR